MLGSPSGVSVEPSSQNLSKLSHLALSVISRVFIYRPEVSYLQLFLHGSASVPIESSPSESSPADVSSLLSYLLQPFLGAKSVLSAVSSSDSPSRTIRKPFTFTLDSASSVHLLSGKAARALLENPVPSNLIVMGVSGESVPADLMGHLIIAFMDPSSGHVDYVDFGLSHGLDGCPLNLLSLPLLFQAGSIAHFEPGNCYFQVRPGSARIPFEYSPEDMFHIKATLPVDQSAQAYPASYAAGLASESVFTADQSAQACTATYAADPTSDFSAQAVPVSSAEGFCFSTSASMKTWHRRLGHLSARELSRIHRLGLVDGFKVSGPVTASCRCDTCRQARLRRVATPRKLEYASEATFVGHTLSTDSKDLPYLSFRGDRYVMIFVDHFHGVVGFILCPPRMRVLLFCADS